VSDGADEPVGVAGAAGMLNEGGLDPLGREESLDAHAPGGVGSPAAMPAVARARSQPGRPSHRERVAAGDPALGDRPARLLSRVPYAPWSFMGIAPFDDENVASLGPVVRVSRIASSGQCCPTRP